jgi:hypothetical protein
LLAEHIDMAAQNSAGLNRPRDVETKHRENSYDKPLTPAPDIQQPGEAGDVGNGAETGHTQPQAPDERAAAEKKSVSEETVTAPKEGAEPSNPYSGT